MSGGRRGTQLLMEGDGFVERCAWIKGNVGGDGKDKIDETGAEDDGAVDGGGQLIDDADA